MFLHRLGKTHAPEFPQKLTWLNSDPLTMKSLRGSVVLIDFWTYSCVNCIRTFPHLRDWHKRYADKGLTIIGVHTPEFDFEHDEKNVTRAVKEFKLKHPIVLDPDYKIWNLYANRWWPRHFLINKDGAIVYDHVGEGGYADTEMAIQRALGEIGVTDLPAVAPDMGVSGGICYRTTPETYLGYVRGRFANAHGMSPNEEQSFESNGEYEADMVYLHGHFTIGKESIQHRRSLPSASEYLALRYSGFSVNLVMGSTNNRKARVEVLLDEQPLPEDMAGEDVVVENGHAIVEVNAHKMYRLVDSDAYHQGVLKLKTASDNLEMFAFTFGGCKGQ